ncbi:MAG: hypothetical protein WBE69_13665 [Candidatus Binataceae bacterium]
MEVEAVLELSTMQVAGEPHRGWRVRQVFWHGRQSGQVQLAERLRVDPCGCVGAVAEWAPRWRFRPYEALEAQRPERGRMLEILLSGVSTRNYARVLPEIAESVGISLSAASREFIAASEDEFKALCERRLDGLEILTSNHMIDKPTSLTNRYGAGARPSGAARSLGFRSNPATTATARSKAADPKDRSTGDEFG